MVYKHSNEANHIDHVDICNKFKTIFYANGRWYRVVVFFCTNADIDIHTWQYF